MHVAAFTFLAVTPIEFQVKIRELLQDGIYLGGSHLISTDRRFIEPDGKGNHNVAVCNLKIYFCVNNSYFL